MGLWSATGGSDQPELLIIAETEDEGRQAAAEYLEVSPDLEPVGEAGLAEGLWGWSPGGRCGLFVLGAGESARRQREPRSDPDNIAGPAKGHREGRALEREAGE